MLVINYFAWSARETDPVLVLIELSHFVKPTYEAVFSLILTIAVIILSISIKKHTGKQQNICLVNWHIMNLLLLIACLLFSAVAQNLSLKNPDDLDYKFYLTLSNLLELIVEFYVDMFLLWLLYRFLRPVELPGDKSDVLGLLIVHNTRKAS